MKYKLIKKLPFEGSPEVGYISTPSNEKDGAHYWNHNFFNPDEHPEFWEKTEDFEILSFMCGSETFEKSSVLVPNGKVRGVQFKYTYNGDENIWNPLYKKDLKTLYHKDYVITSVKRLADGVVFSAGDKVRNKRVERDNNFTIIKFKLSETSGEMLAIGNGGGISIHKIEPSQPILTTCDGVDIFEGDEFFRLDGNMSVERVVAKCGYTKNQNEILVCSKEEVEKLVILNKECLSIKEIISIIAPSLDVVTTKEIIELLKEKVKQWKIK